jgi:hypothetical protein
MSFSHYLRDSTARNLARMSHGTLGSASGSGPRAREPRLTVFDRLEAVWPALAAMEHRDDLQTISAHSVRNDVPSAWNDELTSPRHPTGPPQIR